MAGFQRQEEREQTANKSRAIKQRKRRRGEKTPEMNKESQMKINGERGN